ncbi:flagellar hook assembly protein FlgD [Ancylobacter sp. WKF20]|uniref:flagellar hook assembly protein FlgD n=1 Tax=Ancylobacter sp. WKF20 TaxID=3039801 RepID=UPI00243451A8|nr:flagellar hook assembly protein FlgD [Ancylobacter sp. WKF20]WGD28574.1 flagellar hook assembly protein FlgD [Ancylobacter sp. WKF20]
MTSVNPLASTGAASTSAASAAKPQTLDYTAFLQLLIAQMKYQDPTEPMDTAQYMGQLASFSQVEQSMSANAKLDSLLTSSSLQIADAAIGRTVTSADGTVSGTVTSVRIAADAPMAMLADGREVALTSGVRMS